MGKKLGMSQVFAENKVIAVTAIEAGPCTVVQVKTPEKDGYYAAKLGFIEENGKRKGKEVRRYRYLREIRLDEGQKLEVGQKLDVSLFKAGDKVDIIGTSRGKGFAGGVKRYHFRGGPRTHGQSDRERAPGSVGSNTNPGRVLKGLRMAGHMGNQRVTALNLEVVQADPARNLLVVKGAVPGMTNGLVIIKKSRRAKK
ncbi:MAG: 50S ribosomal protein L3 [Dehalococcoidales bacterium]|nr:50S ribosomal protein L3 [Dehalococcoidales bacterium]